MKTTQSTRWLYFYSFSIFFFMLDILSFHIFERPLLYSLLAFYIAQLRYPMSLDRMLAACTLLSFIPLLYFGKFGLELFYIVPATLIALHIKHVLYDSKLPYIALFLGCLVAQFGIEFFLLHLPIAPAYAISIVTANMIIIGIMSYFD